MNPVSAPQDGKWGAINKKGDVVLDFTYLAVASPSFYDDGYAIVVGDDKKYVIINKKGKEISAHYDVIREFEAYFCHEEGCTEQAVMNGLCFTHAMSALQMQEAPAEEAPAE